VRDDPRSSADSLIEKHGLDGAIKVAMEKTAKVRDSRSALAFFPFSGTSQSSFTLTRTASRAHVGKLPCLAGAITLTRRAGAFGMSKTADYVIGAERWQSNVISAYAMATPMRASSSWASSSSPAHRRSMSNVFRN